MSDAYQKDYNCYLSDCKEAGTTPVPIEEYKKFKTFRQGYKIYCKECKENSTVPVSLEEFTKLHKTEYKLHNWQKAEATSDEEVAYEKYSEYKKKYGFKPLSFDAWMEDRTAKKAYDEYLDKCQAENKEPKSFKAFRRGFNKGKKTEKEEREKKGSLGLVDYFNDMTIFSDDYDVCIPSRYQHIRTSAILEMLIKNSDIGDIKYVKDENRVESIRSRKSFTFVLMKRGYVLSQNLEVIKKLERGGSYFEVECHSQYGVKQ